MVRICYLRDCISLVILDVLASHYSFYIDIVQAVTVNGVDLLAIHCV